MTVIRIVMIALLSVTVPLASAMAETAVPAPSASAGRGDAQGFKPSITRHKGRFGKAEIHYEAIAETIPIAGENGQPEAEIFSVGYTAITKAPATRPVTFLYNGGPGSASFWIQMGAFGPKIVALNGPAGGSDRSSPGSPLVDNPDALLDVTDLVFIDPVGTGFSHAVGSTKDEAFFKITTDASSIAKFIRAWLTRHGRWQSPRFIGGESYGSIRTAMIVDDDPFMTFNGAFLISQGLDWGTVIMPPGYDRGYELFLPSYSAAAWYYHRYQASTVSSVADAVAESQRFAERDYVSALAQGQGVSATAKANVASRLAQLTGIPKDEWIRANLRIDPDAFRRLLLRDRGLRISRFDARYSIGNSQVFDAGERYDPSLSAAALPYLNAMRAYLSSGLGVTTDKPYIGVISSDWTYDLSNEAFINPAPKLGAAMTRNPGMRLFVASGYYDFSSPVSSAQYNIGHGGIPLDRTTMTYYPTGHMMYLDSEHRRALLDDMRAFIVATLDAQAIR